nr:hypothetical protein [uncultured Holophaga sp.]
MWKSGVLGACLFWSGLLDARSAPGLSYRLRLHFRGSPQAIVGRFRLVPTPALRTRNRVHPPRFGGWRLESRNASLSGGVLARVERMLYLSGPAPGLKRRGAVIRYGRRLCPVWDLPTRAEEGVYAYLVEVEPGVLALSYLSGRFSGGDLQAVELQLEGVDLPRRIAPAEDGAVLLRTLPRMADAPVEPSDGGELVELMP